MALIIFMSHSFLACLTLLTLADHAVLTAVFFFRPSRVLPCLLTFCFYAPIMTLIVFLLHFFPHLFLHTLSCW